MSTECWHFLAFVPKAELSGTVVRGKNCRETTGLDKGGECLSVVGGGDVATGVDGDGGCSVVESQLYVGCVLLHFEQVSLPLYFELEEEREEDGQRKEVSALL